MYASSIINSSNFKIAGTKRSALSLGLVLPFYPCMQDEKTIENILKDSEKRVDVMLHKALDKVHADDMFARLQKEFSKLNHDSHCKSIAILLTPDEESVTYLNFPVKPVSYLNRYVSLLKLTANAESRPDFYSLVLEQSHAKIYEYHHNRLNLVYAIKQEKSFSEKTNCESLFKQVLQTIQRLNENNEKPIFITGNPNVVEVFCNGSRYSGIFFRLLNNGAPFDEEIIKRLANEIIAHWNYWQSKFVMDWIMITKKANVLIAEIELVLRALRNGVDGLLLIDKRLKQQLCKSRSPNALFNTGDELMNQVELFLIRGNRIEITETGLLKEFGEIVLVRQNPTHFLTLPSVNSKEKDNRPDMF